MRLTEKERTVIRETTREIFGPDASVYLFGSRTGDNARGGDIDLLVHSDTPINERERKSLQLVARLQLRLGDQPIDVLVIDPETPRLMIHEEALRSGVRL
ncbi:MAG TPA: nucleotidyltransferase domain-containing protein [Gammaproteobacteria bacterium]|nr:nucleotidyltransferase domain-containing protein [Gammaproteobacteria bacterium]